MRTGSEDSAIGALCSADAGTAAPERGVMTISVMFGASFPAVSWPRDGWKGCTEHDGDGHHPSFRRGRPGVGRAQRTDGRVFATRPHRGSPAELLLRFGAGAS